MIAPYRHVADRGGTATPSMRKARRLVATTLLTGEQESAPRVRPVRRSVAWLYTAGLLAAATAYFLSMIGWW